MMFDLSKTSSAIVSVVGAVLLSATAVGAAVAPAEGIQASAVQYADAGQVRANG